MRTLAEIEAAIKALGRPTFPGVALATSKALIGPWRAAVAAWEASSPGISERYALLCEEREATEEAMARETAMRRRAASAVQKAGVPRLVVDALASLQRLPSVDAADAWLASGKPWLVFAGTTGTGKSTAAGHALAQVLAAGKAGAWVESGGFAQLVGGFDGYADMQRLKGVDLLVVDDFGTEHLTSYAQALFFEMLAHRHDDARRTILTTNLDRAALRMRLGSRLADRVASSCHYVECVGESLRGKP